jgi:hypothetical protein
MQVGPPDAKASKLGPAPKPFLMDQLAPIQDMEARVQEMLTATFLKMNYTSPSDRPLGSFSQTPRGTPNPMPLDPATLAEAVAAHKAEGVRHRQ